LPPCIEKAEAMGGRPVTGGDGEGRHEHQRAYPHPWEVESWSEMNRGLLATCAGSPVVAMPVAVAVAGAPGGGRWR
jgi:hypothetical protein